MTFRNSIFVLVAFTMFVFNPDTIRAQTEGSSSAEERGLEIALEADRRDLGWGDSTTELSMTLRNRHGQESSRKLRTTTLEVDGDGDKSLLVFDEPRDVSGTAFLSFTHVSGPDDQWLFLPALGRVKRISSSNKSGPFMGSEFAYEDISSQEVDKYTYRFLGEEEVDGMNTFKLERFPTYEKSGYTRQVVWIDTEHYRNIKGEFYDRKGDLLKTLVWSGFKQYEGKYWRAGQMDMENHQTGKSTTLTFSEYVFSTGLTDRDFDQASLRRAK